MIDEIIQGLIYDIEYEIKESIDCQYAQRKQDQIRKIIELIGIDKATMYDIDFKLLEEI